MNSKSMPVKAQAAAVRSFLDDEGKKMTWIKKNHPDLALGIEVVEQERASKVKPRGSGSSTPVTLPTIRR